MDQIIPGVERMEGKSTANVSKSFSDATTKLLRSQGRSGKVWVFWNSLREGGSQRQHLGRGGGVDVGPGEPSKAPDGRPVRPHPLQQQVVQEYTWRQIGADFLSCRCSRKGYQQLRLRAVK